MFSDASAKQVIISVYLYVYIAKTYQYKIKSYQRRFAVEQSYLKVYIRFTKINLEIEKISLTTKHCIEFPMHFWAVQRVNLIGI